MTGSGKKKWPWFAGLLLILPLFTAMPLSANECLPTEADIEGPFYLPETPFREEIAPPAVKGERLVVTGRILSNDCITPLEGVIIELWHTDTEGSYKGKAEADRFRGRIRSDRDGSYRFSTIVPGRYRLGKNYRPAHIHFRISHPGYETLVTQLYFLGDPYLAPNDPCDRDCRSGDPKRIMALQNKEGRYKGLFMIIMEPSQAK